MKNLLMTVKKKAGAVCCLQDSKSQCEATPVLQTCNQYQRRSFASEGPHSTNCHWPSVAFNHQKWAIQYWLLN